MSCTNLYVSGVQRSVLVETLLRRAPLAVVAALLSAPTSVHARDSSPTAAKESGVKQPRELGAVRWLRDFDAATAGAKRANKPMLVLFDEVPGCHTCVSYGETVLSHPLIAEAAETLFVPVAIYNNEGGADKRVLDMFDEPAWNNPVVRVMTHERTMLAPRVNSDYTRRGITGAMVGALDKSGVRTPAWLALLAAEERAHAGAQAQTAVFGMHCFWEGEAKLGSLDGVLATRTGFLGGNEVVEVTYDPAMVAYKDLLSAARQMQCATSVYTRDEAQQKAAAALVGSLASRSNEPIRPSTKDDAYQIRSTVYASVPMTPAQQTRVNAAVGLGRDVGDLLSPRQLELARRLERIAANRRPMLIGRTDLAAAWRDAERAAN